MKFHVKGMVYGSAIGLVALSLAGCGGARPVGQAGGKAVGVQVRTVRPVPVQAYATMPGTVVSANRVAVASRLMGYIRTMAVHVGEKVHAGQLLFRVDSTSVRARIRQAGAGLARAQANWSAAESTYRRFAPLVKTGAVSPQEFDRIRAAHRAARAGVAAARAGLSAARSQLSYAQVRAPVDGIVAVKLANVGDIAAPGRPILMLENPAHRQVRFTVTGATFARMRLGETVEVQGESAAPIEAVLERLVAAADPVTHTHLAKAGLMPGAPFDVGSYVTVRVPVGRTEAIVVPAAAVVLRAGLRGVFVVTGKSRAQFRMVRTGPAVPAGVIVLAGLAAGDRVVVHSTRPLANGDRIQVEAGR